MVVVLGTSLQAVVDLADLVVVEEAPLVAEVQEAAGNQLL